MSTDATVTRFVGHPKGPRKFIPELGCEVGTFVEPPGGKAPSLRHHVPLNKRGFFRPEDLANYNPDRDYRTDKYGWVLCYAKAKSTGTYCNKRAYNRYPRCVSHGGRLHPLDNLVQETPEGNTNVAEMTRYQQFLAKQITVDDLDDEELTSFGFRDARGRIFKPRKVPREMADAFTKAIYGRALVELKVHTVEAAKTLATIMVDPSNDPSIRLKAAEAILDRNLGKAPQLVSITASSPWEEIFEGIVGGSRNESRQRRGLPVIDAELVSIEPGQVSGTAPTDSGTQHNPTQTNGLSDSAIGESNGKPANANNDEPTQGDSQFAIRVERTNRDE